MLPGTIEERRRGLAYLGRAPWLHFILLGGALFWLRTWWSPAPQEITISEPIRLSAADLTQLRREWALDHGAAPDAAAERQLIEDAIDEEVLYREALARELDRRAPVVRDRLLRVARFVTEDFRPNDSLLEEEAQRLGLASGDVVIRRHLVQTMRLLLGATGPADLPTPAELEAYYTQHASAFLQPARVRLTHVYLSRERRGSSIEADAVRVLDQLRAGVKPEAAAALGDAFIRGADVGPVSRAELERIFGGEFAQAIEPLELQRWTGPVRSAYGLHLVWIHERVPAGSPPLASVRNQVLHRFLEERSAARLTANVQALRQRYKIDVER